MEKNITEKYRPQILKDVLLEPRIYELIQNYINCESFPCPHLLLYGSPGTGKTSLARVIGKERKIPILEINASEERSLKLDAKIRKFCELPCSGFVILDEIDSLPVTRQLAIKSIIEKQTTKSFILICNCYRKVSNELKDECINIKINNASVEQILNRVKMIINKENLTVMSDQDIINIINQFRPDIRRIINLTTLH